VTNDIKQNAKIAPAEFMHNCSNHYTNIFQMHYMNGSEILKEVAMMLRSTDQNQE
jgi:hypothetical protein